MSWEPSSSRIDISIDMNRIGNSEHRRDIMKRTVAWFNENLKANTWRGSRRRGELKE